MPVGRLTNDKAPGTDNISPNLIKTCKPAVLLPLHEILCQCWQEGEVSQNIHNAKIITLYKNYTVILVRLQQLEELVYPESYCGFCSGKSTVDMTFFYPSAAGKM